MNRFEVIAPQDLAHAARLLARPGNVALAGGVDVLDLLKQRLEAPTTLVNLKGLAELRGIEPQRDGGIRLGALTRLSEVVADVRLRARFTAVADAAGEAATPQIRNLGTVGGNLLQRPRCWYFRNPNIVCLKKGGDKCYAVAGLNRYHAIIGGGPSFIVHPSNLAPALIACDASALAVGPDGTRTIALDGFFTGPKVDVLRENTLKRGEIITAVIIPAPQAGTASAYLEVREKQSFDWPLASAAVVIVRGPDRRVRDARVVMGAVAPIPWRSHEAEAVLRGAALDEKRAADAAEAALKPAAPLSDNRYKVPIAKAIVRRAIMKAGGIAEG